MSLVTPGVAWHRRHSSWCLWGSHTLLLYICIFAHYPTMGEIMCATVINTYLFNCLFICIIFYYFSLFFIIIIIISIVEVVHIQLWHCFNTVKSYICVVVVFLWGSQTIWFVILHSENTAHKIFGGYVWHGEINVTSFHDLHVWFHSE